jgi:hypothetical protein
MPCAWMQRLGALVRVDVSEELISSSQRAGKNISVFLQHYSVHSYY